jgi:hypothetical protein
MPSSTFQARPALGRGDRGPAVGRSSAARIRELIALSVKRALRRMITGGLMAETSAQVLDLLCRRHPE